MINFLKKYIAWIILVAAIAALIPTLGVRIANEEKNDNVTMSVFYQNLSVISSESVFDKTMNEYKKMGIDTVTIKEDDINYLVAKGDITALKYNVLSSRYDDESINIAKKIKEDCPEVTGDSHILIVKNENVRERLSASVPLYYTDDDFMAIENVENMDVYVLYDARRELWDFPLGYDEEIIKDASQRGFDIALMHKANGYNSLKYIDKINALSKENNNIKYVIIQKSSSPFCRDNVSKCAKGIADVINNNNLTLVVTENTDQLSNQQPAGYGEIFASVMGKKGSKKLLRAYETYDVTQEDETHYRFRAQQYFNSTLDRNIRFINITQILSEQGTHNDCIEYTLKAAKEYKDKICAEGFTVNGDVELYDYNTDRIFAGAMGAVIMIMCMLLMLKMVFGLENFKLTFTAIVLSAVAFLATYKMPPFLFELYPTVYSVIMSCFAMTSGLYFVKCFKDKLASPILALGSVVVLLLCVYAGSVGLSSMLSGIDFYVNNLIFRGIKLSLLVPIVYTLVAYYFMFIKTKDTDLTDTVKKVLFADIKVYWVIIAGAVGLVGLYYITRSGNVSEISSLEQTLRNTMTDLFPARPRTKEFLIGYPALVLFAYYAKNVDIKLIRWVLATAASILAASVTNSFCHVFTDYCVISMRVVNGFIVGMVISAVLYVLNLAVVKVCRKLSAKFKS